MLTLACSLGLLSDSQAFLGARERWLHGVLTQSGSSRAPSTRGVQSALGVFLANPLMVVH